MIHAAIASSTFVSLLAHRHNLEIAKRSNGGERREPPIHVRRLALYIAVASERIASSFDLEGEEARAS